MKEYQAVLSIFKGSNFVVKRPGGIQCKIIGKVNESILESRVFNINTTCSEPDFNYQIAWKLNKKKFQELRLNRGNVKIECHQLTNDGKIESLIGYCLISIKEAIEITSYEEIDVKNSKILPLTGTKQPWLQYGPKLLCMLHFEDPDKVIAPVQKRKMILKTPTKKDQTMKVPLPPPPSATEAPPPLQEFMWSTNNEMGYFQLGQPGPSDDLYIMNITLIFCQHLRHLLVPKSSKLRDMEWRIMIDAFGITISSDNFMIPEDDCEEANCKSTYLGDKSTARIRANEQEFSRFLNHSVLEMKVTTVKDEKLELQGTAFIELEALTNPEIIEIRSVVNIIPERAKNIPRQHKPQLSQIVDLEKELASMSVQDTVNDNGDGTVVTEFSEVGAGDKSAKTEKRSEEIAVVPEGQSYKDPLAKKYNFCPEITSSKPSAETVKEQQIILSGRLQESSSSSTSKSRAVSIQDKEILPSPIKLPKKSKIPPGNYVLNLKFFGLNIKCRRPFNTNWFVVFYYPPLSVLPEDKCILQAKPKQLWMRNGSCILVLMRTRLRDGLFDEDPISFAHVPLGDIFTSDSDDNNCRLLKGSAAVYTFKNSQHNMIRIGYIGYEFILSEDKGQNDLESSASLFSVTSVQHETKEKDNNLKYGSRKENSIEEWRAQEEKKFSESLKEKEKAYFQILSAEHKKQKDESEKMINEKLKSREAQLGESARTSQFQLHQELEELKLQMRSLEADKNMEVKSLKRQLDDAADLLKIANEKKRCVEIKLSVKDEEIAKPMSNRNKWPDLEALVKIEKLEQEVCN
ncbi:unnamed protein product [Allacma fusca]|uniref:DUF3668 domain-containing protein n=1 Tax=Allacma fusca TaxID=39272 RepID=A0A8J2NMH4_9HEXA|nr:unnamed protein product [Allacma fusca]